MSDSRRDRNEGGEATGDDPSVGAEGRTSDGWWRERVGRGVGLLVVEDNDHARRALCELLEREGIETYESIDKKRALEVFAAHGASVDAALVDWSLPDGNGTDLVERLRSEAPDLPVVYVSGVDRADGSLDDALAAPRTVFLRKPLDPDELIASLRTIVP